MNRWKLPASTKAHWDVASSLGVLPGLSRVQLEARPPSHTLWCQGWHCCHRHPSSPGGREPRLLATNLSYTLSPCPPPAHTGLGCSPRLCFCPAGSWGWQGPLAWLGVAPGPRAPSPWEESVSRWQQQALPCTPGRAGFFNWHFADSAALASSLTLTATASRGQDWLLSCLLDWSGAMT